MSSKIKVVFGVNDFLVGGMQRQLVEQLKHYDRLRFEFSIITLFSFPGKANLYDEIPADIPVYSLSFRGLTDLYSWSRLFTTLDELRPDIVVSSLFFSNLVFRLLQLRCGYASIAREHNTNTGRPWWQRLINRVLASRSYCIVAVSKTVAEYTARAERIPRSCFRVIVNGIDAERRAISLETLPPRAALQESFGIGPTHMMLLNISRLVPQKNHTLLIEGFARFADVHRHAVLCIVGDGPCESVLKDLAERKGVADRVIFFGHRDNVERFYRMADVFVATSTIEGFSNSLLEALASGLPVVATKTAGTDEAIKEGVNGFFIQHPDVDSVVSALEQWVAADRTALSAHALETARKFDIRATVLAYEDLFSLAARP